MARKKRKYSRRASTEVEGAMRERKRGTLRSGRSGKKVKSRKQAVAIGLSEARRAGARVPARQASGNGRRRKKSANGRRKKKSAGNGRRARKR
jgi:hypothetical protein